MKITYESDEYTNWISRLRNNTVTYDERHKFVNVFSHLVDIARISHKIAESESDIQTQSLIEELRQIIKPPK